MLRALVCAASVTAALASPRAATPHTIAPIITGTSSTDGGPGGPPPRFCHGISCPQFTTLAAGVGYELRRYKPSVWVSTVVSGVSYDAAVSQARALQNRVPRAPRLRCRSAYFLSRCHAVAGIQPAVRVHQRREFGLDVHRDDSAGDRASGPWPRPNLRVQLQRLVLLRQPAAAGAHVRAAVRAHRSGARRLRQRLRRLGGREACDSACERAR